MRTIRIYIDTSLAVGASVSLDARAAHHVSRVLRMKPGTSLRLFDGHGHEVEATLTEVAKRTVIAHVDTIIPNHTESPLHLMLGQGISKGERMDFTLQKSAELGVSEITPLWTHHSQVQLDDKRQAKRMEHWRGVLISACEQCGRSTLPILHEPMRVDRWLELIDKADLGLLLDPGEGGKLAALAAPQGAVRLLIGPEGGLSQEECSQATAAGFKGIGLGPRVLRTETAALAALAGLQTLWGDFR